MRKSIEDRIVELKNILPEKLINNLDFMVNTLNKLNLPLDFIHFLKEENYISIESVGKEATYYYDLFEDRIEETIIYLDKETGKYKILENIL